MNHHLLMNLVSNNRPFGSPGRGWDENDTQASVTNPTYSTNLPGLSEDKILFDLDFSKVSNKDYVEDDSGNRNIGLIVTDYELDYDDNRTPTSVKGRFKTLIGKERNEKAY